MDDTALTMLRRGYPEETHLAFSYTPIVMKAGRSQALANSRNIASRAANNGSTILGPPHCLLKTARERDFQSVLPFNGSVASTPDGRVSVL